MTVRELIIQLKKFDENNDVIIVDCLDEEDFDYEIDEVVVDPERGNEIMLRFNKPS